MRTDLSLRQLETILQVAACGSFRRAAAELGQSQPTVSRLIRQAEEILGVRLFDRDTRRVEITAAGRRLLPLAQRTLRDFIDGLDEFDEFLEGRSGHVSIAALPSICATVLPQAIAAFSRDRSRVTFTLHEAPADVLMTWLDDGRADFAISAQPSPEQRHRYQHLHDDPFVLLCRADDPLASRKEVPWSVFATRPCILSAAHSSIRPVTNAVFLGQQLSVHPVMEYSSIATCGAMVAAGIGITALPVLTLGLFDHSGLATVPLHRPSITRPMGIVTRAERSLSPVTRAFIDQLSMDIRAQLRSA